MEHTKMIEIERIYPHPDNPRKSVGDISELTESIKKNGIMQNLTVIPGHFENGEMVEGDYTLIIGHRRCAASKEAGLTELPCIVVEGLSKREQVGIMLEENMQRNDLTIMEQADGFQMMLDLGESIDSIVEKTGFSKSTVYHRLNIAKLDRKILTEKNESFQLTINDLAELEKVKNIETRNKILSDASDSNQIRWKADSAAKQEKIDEFLKDAAAVLKECGIEEVPKN